MMDDSRVGLMVYLMVAMMVSSLVGQLDEMMDYTSAVYLGEKRVASMAWMMVVD